MSQPYVGEIRMFAGSFAPAGWMTCDGQTLPISEYETLFQLIGTTYGGDGQQTFALPKLSGQLPLHMGTAQSGTTYTIGTMAGTSTVTLTTQQIPQHAHIVYGDNNQANTTQTVPTNNFYGTQPPAKLYSNKTSGLATMFTLPTSGGSQPHENMMPYLAITFIISLFGVYPSPT